MSSRTASPGVFGPSNAPTGSRSPERDPVVPALEVRDLRKSFGPVEAIASMSLSIARREFVTLLGPSGSGKTTTLRVIAGFIPPTSGAVLVDGRNVTRVAPHRRNVGMVFQNYALFPHLTAARNVSFPLEMRRAGRAEIERRVEEVFALVGLQGLGERYPGQLSGGQQQRVALARALVYHPSLLLMDEPLGALDRRLRDDLQSEVKRLQQRLGITVLYVTHDQEEALVLSDRIAVVRNGALIQVGTGSDLYERPRSLFVAGFIGDSNVFRGRISGAGDELVLSRGASSMRIPGSWNAGGEHPRLRPGSEAAVVVRPENVRFHAETGRAARGEEGRAHLAARAVVATRLGATLRYEFELPDGQTVRASLTAPTNPIRFTPGEMMTIHWRPQDCLVLPVEEEGAA